MSTLCLWASMESPGPVSAERETTSIQFMEKAKDMVVGEKKPCTVLVFVGVFVQTVSLHKLWPDSLVEAWAFGHRCSCSHDHLIMVVFD